MTVVAILVVATVVELAGGAADEPTVAAPTSSSPAPAVSPSPTPTSTPTPAPDPTRTPTPTPTPTRTPAPDPGPDPATVPPGPSSPRGDDALALRSGRVTNVVDGDTIDLADGTRVRLAIVDTPEVHGGLEPCGREASRFTSGLVLGEDVTIWRPSTAPVTDTYDRLLGEVVREDGTSLNVALAAAGLGAVDERYAHEDPDLAARARAAQSDAPSPACAPVGAPAPSPSPADEPDSPAPAAPAASGHTGRTDGGWACHPAYRECLPAGSGDLDCADVGHQVVLLGNDDPWRLDGNSTTRQDGVGCESYPAWSAGSRYPYE